MRSIFSPIYDKLLKLAAHPHAHWYLGALSISESTFFPVPPDVMLGPMVLARPDRAWYLAFWCTLTSVVGGMLGYLIGSYAFDLVAPLLQQYGYYETYERAVEYFSQYGFWFILVAGFSPIPYKVFTITAGATGMPLFAFVLGSSLGRGGRFFLVSGLIKLGGDNLEKRLKQHVEWIGWGVALLALLVALWVIFLK